eukprot:TRINITY_DN13254_c0_g1_i1.p2 TRINITY_DN13254_c0_g1~~TRINITY_DN13254_c0_g1_i1.p2  ORF type:complete len:243 (+),score=32.93 TRINITY_DN13254_c0_g1_i1:75-803(+)
MFFFFNDTATTEIYTRSIVGSVRCVQETDAEYMGTYKVLKVSPIAALVLLEKFAPLLLQNTLSRIVVQESIVPLAALKQIAISDICVQKELQNKYSVFQEPTKIKLARALAKHVKQETTAILEPVGSQKRKPAQQDFIVQKEQEIISPILVQQENTTVQQAEAVQTIAYPVMSTTFVFQKVYLQNQELALTDILVLPVQFIHSQKQTIVKRITIVLLGLKMSVLQKLILTALSQELLNQETA